MVKLAICFYGKNCESIVKYYRTGGDKMKTFTMSYLKNFQITETAGMSLETYGVTLVKSSDDGEKEVLEIRNICQDESKIDMLIGMMERGLVTPMTAYEVIEDFLEI